MPSVQLRFLFVNDKNGLEVLFFREYFKRVNCNYFAEQNMSVSELMVSGK